MMAERNEMKEHLEQRLPFLSEIVLPVLGVIAFISWGNGWTTIATVTFLSITHLVAYAVGHGCGWFAHKNQ